MTTCDCDSCNEARKPTELQKLEAAAAAGGKTPRPYNGEDMLCGCDEVPCVCCGPDRDGTWSNPAPGGYIDELECGGPGLSKSMHATAPTHLPALLRHLEALKKENAELKREVEALLMECRMKASLTFQSQ